MNRMFDKNGIKFGEREERRYLNAFSFSICPLSVLPKELHFIFLWDLSNDSSPKGRKEPKVDSKLAINAGSD